MLTTNIAAGTRHAELIPVGYGDRTSRTGQVRTLDRGDRGDVSDAGPAPPAGAAPRAAAAVARPEQEGCSERAPYLANIAPQICSPESRVLSTVGTLSDREGSHFRNSITTHMTSDREMSFET